MKDEQKITLITPLNWGLGHATRCIPLIQEFLQKGHQVILASDGRALKLLKIEFPNLKTLELPSYNIFYPQEHFLLRMLLQFPKVIYAIIAEHLAIRKIVRQHGINEILSDNRFGCFHLKCQNIFMTHQINIIIPNHFLQNIIRWINKTWINTFFDQCWIPDVEGSPNLSGKLSHNIPMRNVPVYIGTLSRMKKLEIVEKYDWVAILSGPEPQRTYLEKKIIKQAKKSRKSYKALIIGGKSEQQQQYEITENIQYISFLSTEALNEAMCAAKVIICRSGYSTIMDLIKTQNSAILIPTPKQTEQEYLAQHFLAQGIFFSQTQEEFDLEYALESVSQ
ncbi:MAG: glycosyltransferase [Bacteroidota bacterium]